MDDLLQDTFVVAFKKRHRFDPKRSKTSTWLYGIAANLCRRFDRSERRATLFKRRWVDSGEMQSPFSAQDTLLEKEQELRMVQDVLKKLPFKQREAFVLFELEGMTGKDISTLLSTREGTVWTRLHHARRSFLKHFGKRVKSNG